nr:hypothetical protein [Tanacetum cinerariifolium]
MSCIKQFWNTVSVKQSNDVTRLQALVDKKKVVVTEATIRDALHLDDAEGVDCFPNEEIFATLARMGYEKPSTKLTFYKAFFSSQWKFLIHTILQSMSAKRTSWNEFSSAMASAMICLATGHTFKFSKYIFESLVRNVNSSSKFYMYPRFIILIIQNQLGDLLTHSTKYISPALTQKVFANMRRVGKGCSRVETPLFKGMLVAREPENQGNAKEQGDEEEQGTATEEPVTVADVNDDQSIPSPTLITLPPQQPQYIPSTSQVQSPPPQHQTPPPTQPQGAHFPMSLLQEALDACAALARRVEYLEHDKVAQDLEILKLKSWEKKLERANKVKTMKLRRLRKESDKDEGAKVVNEQEKTEEIRDNAANTQVEGRHADIYHIDMDHAAKVLSMQEDEPKIQEVVEVVTTAKLIREVVAAVSETVSAAAVVQANIPTAPVNAAAVMTTAAPVKDKGKGILVEESKPIKKKQQVELDEAYARKLQEEFNQDIDWETAIDHVKQRAKEERFIQRYQHFEIVPDEDDDVFIEATPLARKVPVVDYQIIHVDNKPLNKIIRADDTHQLFRSFITMLEKFDREDLETLWNIVKERFSTLKPNNFSDEYLLSTLKTMFGRPDGQDNVWKDQRSAHGQVLVKSWKLLTSCGVHVISFTTTHIILRVERRYPLSMFTLEKMINVVRLQVEEQSEMPLELIRFTRQQLQEGHHN